MPRPIRWFLSLFAILILFSAAVGQDGAAATVVVMVPADARLYFDGVEMKKAGSVRTFNTPALDPGRTCAYDVKATVERDGKTQSQTQHISVQAGKTVSVDFRGLDAGSAAEAPGPAPGGDPWPRKVAAGDATITVYQPQLTKWEQNRLEGRAAVAVENKAAPQPAFGVVTLTARTEVDKERRLVALEDFQVSGASFSSAPEKAKDYLEVLRKTLPGAARTVSLDRLEANLAVTRAEARGKDQPLRNDPPRILVSTRPAVLVLIDGPPALRQVDGSKLLRVINTRALVLFDQAAGKYYLHLLGAKTLSEAGILSDATWSKWEGLDREQEVQQGAKKQTPGAGPALPGEGADEEPGGEDLPPAPPGSAAGMFARELGEACVANKDGKGHHDDKTGHPCSAGQGADARDNDRRGGKLSAEQAKGFLSRARARAAGKAMAAKRLGGKAWENTPRPVKKACGYVMAGVKGLLYLNDTTLRIGYNVAKEVARQKGHGEEHVARVARVIDAIDQASTLPGPLGIFRHLELAMAPALGGMAGRFPWAALSYIAYSTVRNPIATMKAARAVVGRFHKVVAYKEWLQLLEADRDAVAEVLAAYERHEGDDWWEALLYAAIDATHDLPKALAVAEKAYAEEPEQVTEALMEARVFDATKPHMVFGRCMVNGREVPGACGKKGKEKDVYKERKAGWKGQVSGIFNTIRSGHASRAFVSAAIDHLKDRSDDEELAAELLLAHVTGGQHVGGTGRREGDRKGVDVAVARVPAAGDSKVHRSKEESYRHKAEARRAQIEYYLATKKRGEGTVPYQVVYQLHPESGVPAGVYVIPGIPSTNGVNLKQAFGPGGSAVAMPSKLSQGYGQPFLLHKLPLDRSSLRRHGKGHYDWREVARHILAHEDEVRGHLERFHKAMRRDIQAMREKTDKVTTATAEGSGEIFGGDEAGGKGLIQGIRKSGKAKDFNREYVRSLSAEEKAELRRLLEEG